MLVLAFLIVILIIALYGILAHKFNYWKNRGVASPPVSYIFGNLKKSFTLERSIGQIVCDIYNEYPNDLYVGFYKIRTPGLVLRDLDTIKTVLIKNFQSFHDNDITVDINSDPVGGRNTFVLKGQHWKTIKNLITPCFTTKRLKEMYPLVEDSAEKLLRYIKNEPDSTGPDGFETMELMAKYATEVVANCAFGLEGKSFDEPNPKFRQMGDKLFAPSTSVIIKIVLITMFPSLTKIFKIRFVPRDVEEYFRNIVNETLKYRKENKVVRNDFLDIMQELKAKPMDYNFTDDDVLAQTLGFFIDGFSTSASVLGHMLYEIAANGDVQENLLTEINETLKKHNGKIEYDVLNEMTYLDNVFNESLRLHPPGLALMRMVTEPTSLPNPKGSGPNIQLEVGTPILIPLMAIHYDPQYFPDPERFDPERFNNNLKDFRSKCFFLPFGEGPRACHGKRFGTMQVKSAVVHIIKNFEIKVNKKTKVPLEIDPQNLILHPKGGIWLNYYKR